MRLRFAAALAAGIVLAPWATSANEFLQVATPERQAELMRQAAAGLQPHRPGVVDLYVISVAGSASEEVFRREAESARAVFDDRFDARGRSVLLANSPTTAHNVPLATRGSLRRMIDEAAARMDPEEDVLLLFLTSHGKPGRFSLSFPGVALNEALTPKQLDRMLDEAGVGWRILIVSACHSGSFIPALESERTLVLTAAAADRVSFGCADENDFTYFGRALIDQELRRSFSFLDAFEAARRTIVAREAAEGFKPSLPQAYVGEAIRGKLDEFERRLVRLSRQGN